MGIFSLQLLCKPVYVKDYMMNIISKDFPLFPIYLSLGLFVRLIKHVCIYSASLYPFFSALCYLHMLGPKVSRRVILSVADHQ